MTGKFSTVESHFFTLDPIVDVSRRKKMGSKFTNFYTKKIGVLPNLCPEEELFSFRTENGSFPAHRFSKTPYFFVECRL